MRAIITFTRTLGLLGCIAITLVACGSATPTPTAAVGGPALLFFYADN